MDRNEFDKDRSIDPEQLDVECTRQVDIFFKWSERAIRARFEADRLKLLLESKQAELDVECRRDPESFGLEKVTEPAVKAAVTNHRDYVSARDAHHTAREELAILEVAVSAMEVKKRMLESLITLHGQQYFAGPAEPRDLKKFWLLHQQGSEKKLTERQIRVGRKRNV